MPGFLLRSFYPVRQWCRHTVTCLGTIAFLVGSLWVSTSHGAFAQSSSASDPELVKVENSLVSVVSFDGDDISAVVSGFIPKGVNVAISSAHALRRGDRFIVTFRDGSSQEAEKIFNDGALDIAILRLRSVPKGVGLSLSGASVNSGQTVYSFSTQGVPGSSKPLSVTGAVSTVPSNNGDRTARFISHNALFGQTGFGGPLSNECGGIVGVNTRDPESTLILATLDDAPDGIAFASPVDAIIDAASRSGINIEADTSVCVPRIERALEESKRVQDAAKQAAERENAARAAADAAKAKSALLKTQMDRAASAIKQTEEELKQALAGKAASETELEELRKQLSEDKKQLEEIQNEANTAAEQLRKTQTEVASLKEEADQLRSKEQELTQQVAQAESEAEKARALADESREEREKIERYSLYGGVAGGLALLATLLFVGIRVRSSRKAVSAAQQEVHQLKIPPSNLTYPRFKIDVFAMTEEQEEEAPWLETHYVSHQVLEKFPDGVRIGRVGGEYDVVLGEACVDISRQHARVFLDGDVLKIEDLRSSNGVDVDGIHLDPFVPVAITPSSRIMLGSFIFRIEIQNSTQDG